MGKDRASASRVSGRMDPWLWSLPASRHSCLISFTLIYALSFFTSVTTCVLTHPLMFPLKFPVTSALIRTTLSSSLAVSSYWILSLPHYLMSSLVELWHPSIGWVPLLWKLGKGLRGQSGIEECGAVHACIHSFIHWPMPLLIMPQALQWAMAPTELLGSWNPCQGRTSDAQTRTAPPTALSANTCECGGLMEIGHIDRFTHRGVLWHQKIWYSLYILPEGYKISLLTVLWSRYQVRKIVCTCFLDLQFHKIFFFFLIWLVQCSV